MSDKSSPLPDKIQFISYHRPALKDGTYTIEATPKLSTKGTARISNGTQIKKFQVSGTRFALKPQEIFSVFPPAGSLGDHENVLPHIVLKRSTIPWERYIDGSSEETPWLALLVFDGSDEIPESKVITFGQLKNEASSTHFPAITNEVGQQDTDQLTVIDVKKELLVKILPTQSDLNYLAHVRQGFDVHNQMTGGEYAVIIANRLPAFGGISKVHLVSLENRYNETGFKYLGASDQDRIRLVSLYSWQFACVNSNQSLPRILESLNTQNGVNDHRLRLPSTNQHAQADALLNQGYVPLKHLMRNGDKGVSWYHSPFATGKNPNQADALPVLGADALLRFDEQMGLFDVSYAAAWELGRMLILQSKTVSVSLFNWKRKHAQQNKIVALQTGHHHLPKRDLNTSTQEELEMPDNVRTWFRDISLLKGVPFNYLAPDVRMLPIESLCFFTVDHEWIACLLDGAFSIGRVTSNDHQQDQNHHQNDEYNPAKNHFETLSGFLMRSEAVAGWPDLHIEAYQTQPQFSLSQHSIDLLNNEDTSHTQLVNALKTDFNQENITFVNEIPAEQWLLHNLETDEQYAIRKAGNAFVVLLKNKLLRKEKLSANVLLCIYEGMIEEVDIFQKPETLHFGVDRGTTISNYHKQLKNRQGEEQDGLRISPLPFRDASTRVLKVANLATEIRQKLDESLDEDLPLTNMDSALFAIEMTEGVERIRFKK